MINLLKNRSDARLCQNTVKERLVFGTTTVALDLMNASTTELYGKIDVANSAERKGSPLPTGCHPELAPLCLPPTSNVAILFLSLRRGRRRTESGTCAAAAARARVARPRHGHAFAKLICEARVYMLQARYRASAVLVPCMCAHKARACPPFPGCFPGFREGDL